jgi:hypothetical protein
MSISSLGNLKSGFAPFVVLQQGTFTKVATTPLVVPCLPIVATDLVLLMYDTPTAGGAAGQTEVITIQPGVSFTATSLVAAFAGPVAYAVVRSTAPVVDV